MEITINGSAKEIAALVLGVQERQEEQLMHINLDVGSICSAMNDIREVSP